MKILCDCGQETPIGPVAANGEGIRIDVKPTFDQNRTAAPHYLFLVTCVCGRRLFVVEDHRR